MCGIAGIIDLTGKRQPDPAVVRRMAQSLWHRGPDEDGFLSGPGLAFASRRLSIVGLGDGRQPIYNEDGTVAVVYNGELFDYPERKAALQAKGHVFRTHTDTELIVHLYEEHGEDVFAELKGQFALALVDFKKRTIFLARDRVGICPLHWAQTGRLALFRLGDQGDRGVGRGAGRGRSARPRSHLHLLRLGYAAHDVCRRAVGAARPLSEDRLPRNGRRAEIVERRYWDFDFPDAGDEEDPDDAERLIDEFEATFRHAVDIRLRADVPVVSYLSGGVDSAYVLATAARVRGSAIPSFTIQVPGKSFDETEPARITARHVGSRQTILTSDAKVISDTYAKLVASADCPVPDTSCASLWCLSQEVHHQGYKVALTGEGSDEAFGGYVWFKLRQLSYWMDVGGVQRQRHAQPRRAPDDGALCEHGGDEAHRCASSGARTRRRCSIISSAQARDRYFSADLKDRIGSHLPYEDVPLDLERMRRWSPLNQSLYFGYKVHLAGQLLNYKGDRVAMANSVETRYPFLDEDFIAFTSRARPALEAARHDQGQVHPAPGRGAHLAQGGRLPGQGHVPGAAGRDLLRRSAALRAPAHEPARPCARPATSIPRRSSADYALIAAGQGNEGQRLPAARLEQRAVDPALAPPLSGRGPVRAARAHAEPAGRAPAAAARGGVGTLNFERRHGEARLIVKAVHPRRSAA